MKNKSRILVLSAIALLGMTAAIAPIFDNGELREVRADSIELNFSDSSKIEKNGVTITFAIGGGSSAPASGDSSARLYAKNTMTIECSSTMTKIEIDWTKNAKKDYASVSANVGNYSHPSSAGTGTWTGSSKKVVFTVGSSGQIQTKHIVITTGAGQTTDPVAVTGVSLNKSSLDLFVGGSETLTATVAPSNATNKNISWESSNNSVATVSDGVVNAVGAGNAVITVKTADGNKTATCSVSVTIPSFTNTTGYENGGSYFIKDSSGNYFVSNGESTPTITKTNAGATVFTIGLVGNNEFEIKTADADYVYATATNNGMKVGKVQDSWTFTSTTGGFNLKDTNVSRYLCSYNNQDFRCYTSTSNGNPVILLESAIVHKTSIDGASFVYEGKSISLSASCTQSDTITWTSSNNAVATVSNGVVTGVSAGNVTITATCAGGGIATKNIEVKSDVETLQSIAVNGQKTTFTKGDNFSFDGTVTGTYSHANGDANSTKEVTSGITYKIDGVAATTSTVLDSVGTHSVVVSAGGKDAAAYTITVDYAPVSSISLDYTSGNLGNEDQATLPEVLILPANANQGFTWSDPKVNATNGEISYSFSDNILSISSNNEGTGTITFTATATGDTTKTIDVVYSIVAKKAAKITGVTVTGPATKGTQYVGKDFDYDGLTFAPVWSEGEHDQVTITGDDIEWNSLVAGEPVTGTYKCAYGDILVSTNLVTVENDALASIAISGSLTKTQYYENDTTFSAEGLTVTGTMKSGDPVSSVSGATFTFEKTPSELGVGNGTVKVTASLNGVDSVDATFNVTILENALTGITADASGMKVDYILGETVDTTGLKIDAAYSNSTESGITSGFTTNAESIDMLTVGDKTLTVTYKGETAEVTIHVAARVVESTKQFEKLTSMPQDGLSGDYVIVYGDYAFNGNLSTLDAVKNNIAVSESSTGVISYSDSLYAARFTFTKDGSYYNIKSSSGLFIGNTSTSNKLEASESFAYKTKITYKTDGFNIMGINGTTETKSLKFNTANDQLRFRFAGNSSDLVQLYKYAEISTGSATPIAMNAASFTPTGLDLKVGDKVTASQFTASILYNDGNPKNVTSGLTINGGNEVTLVEGENTITVAYQGFSKDVVVNARGPRVTDYTLVDSDDDLEVYGGAQIQLEALQASGENDPDQPGVTWSSNNTDVATVDQNGLVTTKVVDADNTKVTITATPTDGGAAGTVEITVNKDDITGIELASAPAKVSYKYGEAFSAAGLAVKYVYESGKKSDAIAYDSSTFTLSVADGTTLDHSMTSVDVTYGGYTINNAFTLTIGKIATSLAIEDYNAIVYEGQEYSLGDLAKATVTYSDNSTSEVTIPSDNVTVDTSTAGNVQGTASITIDGVTVSATLDVTVKQDKVTSIQFLSGATNVEYDHHEAFNPEGIVIKVIYESGANEEVQYNDSRLSYNVTTLDTVGDQTITATFEDAHGNTASADMGQKVIVSKTISKVETTSYEVYKDYNAAGTNTPVSGDIYQSDNITIKAVITTTYSDGTTKQVTKLVSFGTLVEGENTATTTVDGVTLTYKIENVIGVELSSLILDTTNVTKTGYIEGQTADLSGLVVKAHYNNGADVILDSDEYTVEGTTDLTVGQNTITVSYAGKSATFMVTANQKQVASVELVGTKAETYLTEEEITNLAGNGYQLKVNYDNNTSETIDITQSMVSVNGNTVTVTYSGKTATYTIVALNAASASSITLENATGTTTVGDSYSFNPGTVTAHFVGTDKTIELEAETYTVDAVDTSVPGQATYYVTVNGTTIKAAFTVTVNYADPTGVAISGNTTQVYKPGQTVQLSATVNPDNALQAVTWSSSNTGVATVDANGLVTFLGYGEVTITATTSNGKTTTVTLTCANPVTSVTLNKETLEMDLEENYEATLVATVNPTDAETTNVNWTSSDESVVSVDSNGNLIANKAGTAVITASCGGKEATCTVTVTGGEVEPVNPDNPSSGNTGVKVGCVGSIAASTLVVSLAAAAGAAMLVSKKRKEDK